MIVVALALPVGLLDKARSLLDAERNRDLVDYANGQRDEARRALGDANRIRGENSLSMSTMAARVEELADELKITSAERDAYLADVQRLTDRAEESERHLARAMSDSNAAVGGWSSAGKRLDALQSALDDCYSIGWRAIVERDTARACLGLEHADATNEERRLRKALAEANARADRLIAECDAQGSMV